jgi:hypothetical protein
MKKLGYKHTDSESQTGARVVWMSHEKGHSPDELLAHAKQLGSAKKLEGIGSSPDEVFGKTSKGEYSITKQGRGSIVARLYKKGPKGERDKMGIDEEGEPGAVATNNVAATPGIAMPSPPKLFKKPIKRNAK